MSAAMTSPPSPGSSRLDAARAALLASLSEHALLIGEVTLTSGRTAQYYVDVKRAILLPSGFRALSTLVSAQASEWGATAVGGMTMGADPIACAALAGGADVKAFFVRKEVKPHGLSRRVEGPLLDGADRCMLVEDAVTTGGSTVRAIEALQDEGRVICGVLSICDRLAGGADAIVAASDGAPYRALSTVDDVYPERPDR
jgi:orotate phosphoribosyltransferase